MDRVTLYYKRRDFILEKHKLLILEKTHEVVSEMINKEIDRLMVIEFGDEGDPNYLNEEE